MEAGSIQAIDRKSVHQICSGQVVLTLATAVKELVENSIDAGATTVEVRLKEYGSECIEVTDNGSGVEEKNFEGLTLKHYTSKLSDFSDLISVATFGFRGEALSSLCALSNMVVMTRHESATVGTKLEFDADGKIVTRTPVPRQRGTTVTLQNLFHTLPVRHREFQRNLKKDTGVRITCSNQTAKGSRSTLVSTSGNATVKDNISNIFGPKQLQSLLPFEQRAPSEDVCTDYGLKVDASHSELFSIEGFVSKCEHGQGRSSTDRQFLFINRRPCDATKILKVINEVYHSYNRHQYPFIVLLITMAKESVDVNVTPDKRQIFVEGEKILLATLKTSLIKMYEPTTSILRVNLVPTQAGSSQDGALSSLARLKRSFSSAFDRSDRNSVGSSPAAAQPDKQRKLDKFFKKSNSTPPSLASEPGAIKQYLSSFSSPFKTSQRSTDSEAGSPKRLDSVDVIFVEHTAAGSVSVETSSSLEHPASDSHGDAICGVSHSDGAQDECDGVKNPQNLADGVVPSESHVRVLFQDGAAVETDCSKYGVIEGNEDKITQSSESIQTGNSGVSKGTQDTCREDQTPSIKSAADSSLGESSVHFRTFQKGISHNCDNGSSSSFAAVGVEGCSVSDLKSSFEAQSDSCQNEVSQTDNSNSCKSTVDSVSGGHEGQLNQVPPLSVTVTEFDQREVQPRQGTELPFSFQRLRECLSSPEMHRAKGEKKGFSRSFRAKICPDDNRSAEEELQREISKDMFEKMKVLGQFNLGFIIARSGQDLFIVDQHATDEKYNFEMLQRNTVLQSQPLIHPQCLELTASNEIILMDNLHIFKKNGFDFVIDEEAPPTQRVKLKSSPASKNWNFGKDDIEELIFMLTDSPGIMCRPSRVRMMFASRACRKSIMIGTALNHAEMKKLLSHMGEIEQPWNCPHGRPTMRHLINLDMLPV
ncbi:hypothetical protein BaRGS_00024973 [Batillaria attramentaria]|uniref:Mismatch repair endonuclease PMS2 n=1 Tax=Batillaria attramentaria TaxID=370345 RepID=A0ABD0K9K2_9CAEN